SAERERRAEAQRAALRAIPPGAQYIGRASILNESWGVPQPFVVLTVTPSGDTFNVAARYPSIDLSVAMTGLIAEAPTGPALQLSNGRMEIGSQISGILALNHVERQLQGQAWSLRVAEPGNAESHLVGSGTRMGTIDLEPMTDAWKRRQAETIRNALTTGAKFHAWVTTMRHEQASVFEFKLDAASGQLTGANPEMSRTFSLRPGTNFIGSLSEDLGSFHGTFKMAQANLADRSMDWWAFVEPDNNILLIGSFGQISTNRRMKPSFEMTLAR
ncbi:MAG: hypothetical protein KDI31_08150, partial [Pseudomonadales bacterium]|nr:hypothetical protein [Pseudomonadales bacterium]